ncbi:MAG: hypothetical protein HWE25_02190 [Alphaproteobacteria bacterium]|nr:hypothetical protein [Alphaproteobacteria bacterium]
MKKILLAALLLFSSGIHSAFAQEEETAETIEFPFIVEMKKPITLNTTYTMQNGPAHVSGNETVVLTPLKQKGDQVIYRYKSVDSELVKTDGLPPLFEELVAQIGAAATGVTYEYAADATGYPLELTRSKDIKAMVKKARKSLMKWAKKYAKANKLGKEQEANVLAATEQAFLEEFPEDEEALGPKVLEQGQLIFYGTGRSLYLDYYTEFNTTRYFEPGQATFHTIDSWAVVSIDEEKGEAVISLDQNLNDEEYQAFLGRLKTMLMEQHGPAKEAAVDALVEKYRNLKLTRQAEYVLDMKTGLPSSGTIRSEQVFDGNAEIETIEFTMGY